MTDGFTAPARDDDPAFDTTVSHQARYYNYLLGGKDWYAADKAFAEKVLAAYPDALPLARDNRAFLGRAVRFLAGEGGLSQFLDIGTGIPAPGSTHEVAQEVRPDSRIVYVDNDPIVLSHARAFLVGREPGSTGYLDADLREPENIIRQAAQTLDFTRPVGLLLIAILHAFPDAEDPFRIVAELMDALPSGSYLAITHWGKDPANEGGEQEVAGLSREMSRQQYYARTPAEVGRFFDGLELLEPGLVPLQDWRPGPGARPSGGNPAGGLGGVARKP